MDAPGDDGCTGCVMADALLLSRCLRSMHSLMQSVDDGGCFCGEQQFVCVIINTQCVQALCDSAPQQHTMGLQGHVGSAHDTHRIRIQEKQREEERKRFEGLKKQSEENVRKAGLREFGKATSEVP